ncbi:MAG: UDP-N-acetylmuramoyl-tripeptide--D-alanyl-D-alanine ligase [Streptococcaceae bacterium]|jgi:UDP-N-acetylmuramoyl-tripeptide--D-alanyl-D-alanine ligase|nr:UDP-N-acetylmuramoyl-tripeptide--D-alanyl-D-alanine ligase [Streptococcaceae bacterium]
MNLTLHEIGKVVNALNDYSVFPDEVIKKIEFDSRKISAGDLFLPLKGVRDGHDFIKQAQANGAQATFSERDESEIAYLRVVDTLAAFQKLAAYYRQKMQVKVIAVTGSNGKTTTKDMIAATLSAKYATYKTQGNYNNELGLPYTILQMPEDTDYLILEMGQDHFGDIHLLSELARPNLAVVTMVGEAHLAFFKDQAQIAEGKMQIQDGLVHDGGLIIPNDPLLRPFIRTNQVTSFGEGGDIYLTNVVEGKDKTTFEVNFVQGVFEIPVSGAYNAKNALLAVYIAHQLGVETTAIIQSLRTLKLTKNRTQWIKSTSGIEILSDVYNANPTAMALALDSFSTIQGEKKVAVLADMLELGESSKALHQSILLHLNPEVIQRLFLYGEEMWALAEVVSEIYPIGAVRFYQKNKTTDEKEALISDLLERVDSGTQVFLKGSNSMQLDEVVAAFLAKNK